MDVELMTKAVSGKYTQDEVYKMLYEPKVIAERSSTKVEPKKLDMPRLMMMISMSMLTPAQLHKMLYPMSTSTDGGCPRTRCSLT